MGPFSQVRAGLRAGPVYAARPTFSEAIKEALLALPRAIHLPNR
jgi:hypothetical protein